MGYLKNKIVTVFLFLLPLVGYGQWSYTFTDPCTLNQQTIQMGSSDEIVLNYFGNVQTFTQLDFTDGTFDSWMNLVTQSNSSNPCQEISQIVTNNTNAIIVQNTITVITNIMSVLGGDMLPQALSSSGVPVAEAIDNASKGKKKKRKKKKNETKSDNSNSGTDNKSNNSDNKNKSESNNSSEQSNETSSNETNSGQGSTNESGTSTEGTETKTEDESKEGGLGMSLANSVSNAMY